MTTRLLALAAICLNCTVAVAADDVKEIELKGLKADVPMTRPDQPTEIKTAEELAKVFPQKEVVDSISKNVDFSKQKLVFFAWAGSGGDKITAAAAMDEITFTYKGGLTRDLRPHFKLFAIPKESKFKFEKAKSGK